MHPSKASTSNRYDLRFAVNEESNQRGSASIEFIAATVLLLLPVLYLVITLAQIQNHTLGAEAAARHIALRIAQGGTITDGEAVMSAIADSYDMPPETTTWVITCAGSGECPRAGAIMTITVTSSVPLPLVPAFFPTADIPIGATAVHKISEYSRNAP